MELELQRLRTLIGRGVIYRGATCCIVEVLEDGPALVLRDTHACTRQHDQFGEPVREVPATYTVPVFGPTGEPNVELLELPVQGECP